MCQELDEPSLQPKFENKAESTERQVILDLTKDFKSSLKQEKKEKSPAKKKKHKKTDTRPWETQIDQTSSSSQEEEETNALSLYSNGKMR